MVLRRFWKQHFPRWSSVSGVCAFGPGGSSPPGCALCAAGIIDSEGGEGRGKSFRKSVPLVRGADRSSLGHCPTWGPRDANETPTPLTLGFLDVCFSVVVETLTAPGSDLHSLRPVETSSLS